jgi:signal transduction histidine kinase
MYDSFIETFQLLNNLLIWANTQVKGITANVSTFNLWQTINQNIKLSDIRARSKNILVETNETTHALYVHADMYMTDIVMRNLLENAIKFSNPGGIVTILAEKKEGLVQVSVIDNGRGISAESQAKLFRKVSFHTTRGTAGEKGSGLGLQITKEMVEKNGGKIWLESAPGKGSTFYFTLPGGRLTNELDVGRP